MRIEDAWVAAGPGHVVQDGVKAEMSDTYIGRGTATRQNPAKCGLPSPRQATQDGYALPSSGTLIWCIARQRDRHAARLENVQLHAVYKVTPTQSPATCLFRTASRPSQQACTLCDCLDSQHMDLIRPAIQLDMCTICFRSPVCLPTSVSRASHPPADSTAAALAWRPTPKLVIRQYNHHPSDSLSQRPAAYA